MTIVEGSYLLWFAHYGRLEFREMNSIEDAMELVVRLRDCESWEFDEYGAPDFLEKVGHGVVEDFFARCDELEERRRQEWREDRMRRERERATSPSVPRYSIELSPPADQSPRLSRPPQHLVGGLDHESVIVERDRLEALFGRDRISVRQNQRAAAS